MAKHVASQKQMDKKKESKFKALRRKDTSEDTTGGELELIRSIFYRYVNQATHRLALFGQFQDSEFSVALAMAFIVDTAADHPEVPLSDLKIAMEEKFRVPPLLRWLAKRKWPIL
eukprot:2508770-Prymnesium_polylepis.1